MLLRQVTLWMMTMDDNRLPPDELYAEGVSIGTMADELDRPTPITDGIDWDQSLDVTDDVERACGVAAVHFHYANTAHLVLCGKILYRKAGVSPLMTKKLAATLCQYKLEDIDLWGRYLARVNGEFSTSPLMHEYYERLFAEDDLFSVLIAMETLGCPVARVLYDNMQTAGDPVFQQLTQKMAQQKQEEQELVTHHLRDIVGHLSPQDKQHAVTVADRYCSLAMQLLGVHSDTFTALGIDPDTIQRDVHQAINQFYRENGLEA